MNTIVTQVIVLFLIMVVGYISRKRGLINPEVNKSLSELLLNVTLPFMIIASFNFKFSTDMLNLGIKLFLISTVIHTVLLLLGSIIYKRFNEDEYKVLWFITVFSNCGFMGYPVVESIYGKIGLFYAALFNIPFNILMWTAGVFIFSGRGDKQNLRKAILNPGILSVFIGLIIFLFSVELPAPVIKTLEMVGSMTTPLSMIIIGSTLADAKIKSIFEGFSVYFGSFIRLIAIPLIVYFILNLFGLKDFYLNIPVIITAMPAAANTVIMAEKYGGNPEYASKVVFLTTILSVVTIPAILILLK
ncbi:AEC family transporter [Caloramator sp. ALD01]|uniref:AEC family transporter n=1 Tax=Caloramator sp. ALD01 TaxID=1031288 RepID=UPI00040AA11C|nr:AEC family transporter [Caloramator sp. ALD01]